MDRRTLLGDHLVSMRRSGRAGGTIAVRRHTLMAWFNWLELHDVGVFEATTEDVEVFLDEVRRKPSSRAATTSHVHMFYKWARARQLTVDDPTEAIERPRQVIGLPRPIHDTDLQLALLFAQERADPRMVAGLLMGAASGLRCCELGRLRWDDVHDGQVRVMGKGSKERVVPLNAETIDALDRLERTSGFVLDGWQSSDVDNPGMRASRRFTAHFRAAGVTGSAHRLRHRAATEALRKCHDIRRVQTLLGHASVATTAIYTQVDSSDLRGILADVTAPMDIPADQGSARNEDFAQRRQIIVRRRPR